MKKALSPLQALKRTPLSAAKENVQEKKEQHNMPREQSFKNAKSPMQALKMTPIHDDPASPATMRGVILDAEMRNDSFDLSPFDISLVSVLTAKGKSQEEKSSIEVDLDDDEPRPRGGAFGGDGAGDEEEYYSANEDDPRQRGGGFGAESWASRPDSPLLSSGLNFGRYDDGDINKVPLVSKKKPKWPRLRVPGEDEMSVVSNDEKMPEWSRLRIPSEDEMPKANNDEETPK